MGEGATQAHCGHCGAVIERIVRLKLTTWHLLIWLCFAVMASALAVSTCLRYNKVAGTDKTPGQIAAIAAGVLAGPMVGQVANPAATGERAATLKITLVLFGGLLASLLPFCVLKRDVPKIIGTAAWCGFVLMSGLWFFGALVSLGLHLS